MNAYDVILRPLITEESMERVEKGEYTFLVHPRANKVQIGKAVEEIFKVQVVRVNTSAVRPKLRRMGQYEGYKGAGKKAIVKVKEGQKIAAFEGLI
ncbi:MAG: 50S ribosomal protein L23 [Bacillota bacterium]|nr:50S ribosomal protein L23 [Bacillota bacterium]